MGGPYRALVGCGPGGYQGGLYRVGTGWVGTGEYYPPSTLLEEGTPDSRRRAPEAPAGGWSGWSGVDGRTGNGGGSQVPPYGPGRSLQALPVPGTLIAALQPIGRDSTSFL